MPKIIPIPDPVRGRPSHDEYDKLARDVSQLPPGAAIERSIPSGRRPHTYRTAVRLALAQRGVLANTAVKGRKLIVWPKMPAESVASD